MTDRPARPPRPAPVRPSRRRGPLPDRASVARALVGAAVSVAGVLLGIGSLLLLSDPSSGPGPVVAEAASSQDEPREVAEPDTSPPPAVVFGPQRPSLPPAAGTPAASTARSPAAALSAPPSPSLPAPSASRAASPVVPVTVLNNSRITGLADRAAAGFRRGGWPVRETGNIRGRIPVTTVYYGPGQRASAEAFARRFRGVQRVLPRFASLPGSGLVVVVTRDYS